MRRGWWLAVALAMLAGCATAPGPRDDGGQATMEREGPLEPGATVQHNVDNRAVAILWEKAEEARRAGELDRAVTSLERAVRLAPEDPVLWSRLAEVRLRQRDFAMAENLAAKSNALAGERRLLRYRNWLIIAEARRRRGDEAGAEKARAEAERLRQGSS
jgi:predicted Zn-dependent protease